MTHGQQINPRHDRYVGGLADFLDVLEAERALLTAQDNRVRSDRRLTQSLIRLYKSLGSGWTSNAELALTSPNHNRALI